MLGQVFNIFYAKVTPLQAMKAHGDVDGSVHIFIATVLGRGRAANPTLARLYPSTNFIGG